MPIRYCGSSCSLYGLRTVGYTISLFLEAEEAYAVTTRCPRSFARLVGSLDLKISLEFTCDVMMLYYASHVHRPHASRSCGRSLRPLWHSTMSPPQPLRPSCLRFAIGHVAAFFAFR
ncbi:hypothetical protein C2E23DRAFT_306321 [Lenzites betulinus]|nr:hypothetical protein C2E23DRAFT_306321 [Lenzites betulinus]